MTIGAVRITRFDKPITKPVLVTSLVNGKGIFNVPNNSLAATLGGAIGSWLSGSSNVLDTLKEQFGAISGLGDASGLDLSTGLTALLPNMDPTTRDSLIESASALSSGDKSGLIQMGDKLLGGMLPEVKPCTMDFGSASPGSAIAGGSGGANTAKSGALLSATLKNMIGCGAKGVLGGILSATGNSDFGKGLVNGLGQRFSEEGYFGGVEEVVKASSISVLTRTTKETIITTTPTMNLPPEPNTVKTAQVAASGYERFAATMSKIDPSWLLSGGVATARSIPTGSDAEDDLFAYTASASKPKPQITTSNEKAIAAVAKAKRLPLAA